MLIDSIDNLLIATELKIVVFYVVWKDYHYEREWKGLKYRLELVHMSETDQIKLREVLLRASARKNNFPGEIAESEPTAMEASPHQNNWVAKN